VNELASLLGMVESGDYVGLELVLDAEVSLEVQVEELEELLLQLLGRAALREGEVFIVGELTEVLR